MKKKENNNYGIFLFGYVISGIVTSLFWVVSKNWSNLYIPVKALIIILFALHFITIIANIDIPFINKYIKTR